MINNCTSSCEKLPQAIVDKYNQKFKVSAQKLFLFKWFYLKQVLQDGRKLKKKYGTGTWWLWTICVHI